MKESDDENPDNLTLNIESESDGDIVENEYYNESEHECKREWNLEQQSMPFPHRKTPAHNTIRGIRERA